MSCRLFYCRSLYNYYCLYTCMTTLVSRSAGIIALCFLNVYGQLMDLMISIILAVFPRIKGLFFKTHTVSIFVSVWLYWEECRLSYNATLYLVTRSHWPELNSVTSACAVKTRFWQQGYSSSQAQVTMSGLFYSMAAGAC